jgi:hypothetical protein
MKMKLLDFGRGPDEQGEWIRLVSSRGAARGSFAISIRISKTAKSAKDRQPSGVGGLW